MSLTPRAAGLARLHAKVDRDARRLADRHGPRLRCAVGCASCCVDGIRVFAVEAERIQRAHADLLKHGSPHPAGACAFRDDAGACRVYDDRPYVCRTQGLPLRWSEQRGNALVEWRDICPLNEAGGPPLESLPPDLCWTIGPTEGRLAELEHANPAARRRLPLRSLFRRR